MNEYERLLNNESTSPVNHYSYGGRNDLTACKLYIAVLTEEICKRLGAADVAAIIAFLIGQPFLTTRQKFAGTTLGTSIASQIARELLDFNLPVRVPTLTNQSMAALRFSMTCNLGAVVGRWTPQIGAIILVYDVVIIDLTTTLHFNKLAKPEDRISDRTVGTLG